MTGASSIPVLGFGGTLTMEFVHGCPNLCKCYPTASTCDLILRIPVHLDTLEDMSSSFLSALKDGFAFGAV